MLSRTGNWRGSRCGAAGAAANFIPGYLLEGQCCLGHRLGRPRTSAQTAPCKGTQKLQCLRSWHRTKCRLGENQTDRSNATLLSGNVPGAFLPTKSSHHRACTEQAYAGAQRGQRPACRPSPAAAPCRAAAIDACGMEPGHLLQQCDLQEGLKAAQNAMSSRGAPGGSRY